MTKEETLRKAIEKAEANGWTNQFVRPVEGNESWYLMDDSYFTVIFSRDFAQAFWPGKIEVVGDWKEKGDTRILDSFVSLASLDEWEYRLQQMVLEEDPIIYLKQFLDE
jgi:hypothetical protein